MKIAIISDIHDQVWNLRPVLEQAQKQADMLICCGDLCSPFIIPLLAEAFEGPIHVVFGNNDADLYRISLNAARYSQLQLHGEVYAALVAGRRIFVNHFPEIALPAARSGDYDLVCYGHNHIAGIEQAGDACIVLNPGPVMGYQPGSRNDVPATWALYDCIQHRAALMDMHGNKI